MASSLRTMFSATIALTAVALTTSGTASHADTVIFDSTNKFTTNNTGPVIGNFQPIIGESFTTGILNSKLTNVTAGLYRGNGTGGKVTLELYSNSGNRPGTDLGTVATILESSLTLTPTLYSYTPVTNFTLAGNTRYWLLYKGGTGGGLGVYGALQAQSTDLSGIEDGTEYTAIFSRGRESEIKNAVLGTAAALKITVSEINPITPEPGTLGLLAGLFCTGAGVVRRRRMSR